MSMMQTGRFIKTMRKSAAVLNYTLQKISQEQATTARDGEDGWTVLEMMCHIRDFDEIFLNRCLLIANQDQPELTPYDHEKMVTERDYAAQNLAEVLADYQTRREEFINWLSDLPEADWQRSGLHPEHGTVTIMEIAMQAGHHDLDHVEQILRSLQS